jgi:hypothetical protein
MSTDRRRTDGRRNGRTTVFGARVARVVRRSTDSRRTRGRRDVRGTNSGDAIVVVSAERTSSRRAGVVACAGNPYSATFGVGSTRHCPYSRDARRRSKRGSPYSQRSRARVRRRSPYSDRARRFRSGRSPYSRPERVGARRPGADWLCGGRATTLHSGDAAFTTRDAPYGRPAISRRLHGADHGTSLAQRRPKLMLLVVGVE